MTIRSKLAWSISLLLIVSTSVLGYGVLLVSQSLAKKDAARTAAVIESMARKAALDALIQKDDLLLISYVNFIHTQYPALSYAKITWLVGDRARTLKVGEVREGPQVERRAFEVKHPVDPQRRVRFQLGLDMELILAEMAQGWLRLQKIIVLVSGATLVLGMLFSYLFARSLTAPLGHLVELAGEISTGKLGGRLEWASDDEIGGLVKVFNKMSGRLEELDETKKNFVSSVTHELRSPLGAIASFLHLIEGKLTQTLKGPEAKQYLEYLQRIQTNVTRLSGFINDLLDVAKIEKGKMECVLKPMLMQEIAREVCQFFELKAKDQGVRLAHRLEDLPEVMGDAGRLRQVLVNLIANSLKFTPDGGKIVISGEQFREGVNRWVEVSVRDTGRGMEAADVERLFKAFSQGRNTGEGVMGPKGTGLGLFITKSIVEQHGGKIDVKSVPGQGTQMVFSLRVATTEADQRPPEEG